MRPEQFNASQPSTPRQGRQSGVHRPNDMRQFRAWLVETAQAETARPRTIYEDTSVKLILCDPKEAAIFGHHAAMVLSQIRYWCAPACNAEPHLAPLNSLIGHNKEKLGQCKSASRGTPLWSTLSVCYSNTQPIITGGSRVERRSTRTLLSRRKPNSKSTPPSKEMNLPRANTWQR